MGRHSYRRAVCKPLPALRPPARAKASQPHCCARSIAPLPPAQVLSLEDGTTVLDTRANGTPIAFQIGITNPRERGGRGGGCPLEGGG